MPTLKWVGRWLACALLWCGSVHAQELTDSQLIELILRDGTQARAIRATVEVTRREQAARTLFPNPGIAYVAKGRGFTDFSSSNSRFRSLVSREALMRVGTAATAAAEAERDARCGSLRAEHRRSLHACLRSRSD